MSKEVVPVWGIENYSDTTPYDYRRDNNRVFIEGAVFDSYMPCEFAQETQASGGLGMMEQVIFTETEDKKLPSALKDGIMTVSDTWVVMVQGKEYDLS